MRCVGHRGQPIYAWAGVTCAVIFKLALRALDRHKFRGVGAASHTQQRSNPLPPPHGPAGSRVAAFGLAGEGAVRLFGPVRHPQRKPRSIPLAAKVRMKTRTVSASRETRAGAGRSNRRSLGFGMLTSGRAPRNLRNQRGADTGEAWRFDMGAIPFDVVDQPFRVSTRAEVVPVMGAIP